MKLYPWGTIAGIVALGVFFGFLLNRQRVRDDAEIEQKRQERIAETRQRLELLTATPAGTDGNNFTPKDFHQVFNITPKTRKFRKVPVIHVDHQRLGKGDGTTCADAVKYGDVYNQHISMAGFIFFCSDGPYSF